MSQSRVSSQYAQGFIMTYLPILLLLHQTSHSWQELMLDESCLASTFPAQYHTSTDNYRIFAAGCGSAWEEDGSVQSESSPAQSSFCVSCSPSLYFQTPCSLVSTTSTVSGPSRSNFLQDIAVQMSATVPSLSFRATVGLFTAKPPALLVQQHMYSALALPQAVSF